MLSQAETISSIYSSERIFKKNLLRIDKVIAMSLVYYIFGDTVVTMEHYKEAGTADSDAFMSSPFFLKHVCGQAFYSSGEILV